MSFFDMEINCNLFITELLEQMKNIRLDLMNESIALSVSKLYNATLMPK